MIKTTKDNAWILPCLAAQGVQPSVDDKFFFNKEWHLQRARETIAERMLGQKQAKEIPLADLPTDDGYTIADLPEAVATAIAKPYGTLGIDSSEKWGATTSPWFLFQHQAEDYIRGKISRCMMRKLPSAIERLELALGCFKWAAICGVSDIPKFQGYFTSALIFDRDATVEMNGETIDVEPTKTTVPISDAMLMQVWEELKRVGGIVADIYKDMPKQPTPRRDDYVVSQPQLSKILTNLRVPITVRQIQNWELSLRSNYEKGTKPPEGYTLQTRMTLESATAWATTYAHREQSKINTKNALGEDSLKTVGQRDKNLDRASGQS